MDQAQQSMDIMCRMHADRRMIALESVQVLINDTPARTALQWRASAINDADDTVSADGSSPLEALTGLNALVYPSASREGGR